MKVLLIAPFYAPQRFPRAIQISHLVHFLKDRVSLKILTSQIDCGQDESLLTFTPMDQVIHAPKPVYLSLYQGMKGDVIKKNLFPDEFFPWVFSLYAEAKKIYLENSCDICVTFGQPMSTHIIGLWLKKKYPDMRWIAHFSDPWVDNPFARDNFFQKIMNQYFQNKVFQNADRLVFTSSETVDIVMQNYPALIKQKCDIIPHAYRDDLYPSDLPGDTHEKITLRYVGNFYGPRQPGALFQALTHSEFRFRDKIRVDLVGAGQGAVQKKIEFYGLQDCVFAHGPVNYLESLRWMVSSDLLLNIDAPSDLSPFLPSKLIDYIGSGKPIFGITPTGTAKRVIEDMGFPTALPENHEDIARKLSNMIDQIISGNKPAIKADFKSVYHIDHVGPRMLRAFQG